MNNNTRLSTKSFVETDAFIDCQYYVQLPGTEMLFEDIFRNIKRIRKSYLHINCELLKEDCESLSVINKAIEILEQVRYKLQKQQQRGYDTVDRQCL